MEGSRQTLEFEKEKLKPQCLSAIASAEIIFCLDFNAISRLEELGDAIASADAQKVVIDHHQQPEAFAAITISDTTYAATSEMIFDIIQLMGDSDIIDSIIAENLYTGIATDTGFFQFSNTTPNVMRALGFLIGAGARPDYVSDRVNNIYDLRRMRYLGFILSEKLKIAKKGKVACISINTEEAKRFNLQLGDNDGIVNYGFKVEGVQVCALFTEEKDRIKISLRSKGSIDVNAFARQYFQGGGHVNASGGKHAGNMESAIALFLEKADELL